VKHSVNAAEVLLCPGTCSLNVRINSHIKLNNLSWGVKLAGGSLSDGKTTTSASQENFGTFALSQLGNSEGQRSIGKHPCDHYLLAIQNSHAVNGSCWGVFVAGSLDENWNNWWHRACW
jgi:hypothetical protein